MVVEGIGKGVVVVGVVEEMVGRGVGEREKIFINCSKLIGIFASLKRTYIFVSWFLGMIMMWVL